MRICIITFEYPPIAGGVGRATLRIAKNLVDQNLEIHVIAPGENKLDKGIGAIKSECEDGVYVYRTFKSLGSYWGDPKELQAVGDYITLLHNETPFDLIHAIFLIPCGQIAAIVAREIGIPFVASIRGSDIDTLKYYAPFLGALKWILEKADVVTSVSLELLQKVKKFASINNSIVISNSFDASLYISDSLESILQNPESSNALKFSIQKFLKMKTRSKAIVGTVGRIRPVKGFPLLLTAIKQLAQTDVLLLVVGDFRNSAEKIRGTKLIKELGLEEQVLITGWISQDQVLSWIREMDVFLFPSLHEGSPNAILEAMACQRPIVASQVGGIVDMLTDGKDALLVPPNAPEIMAKKISLLFKDQELRTKLSRTAYEKVETEFSVDQESQKWQSIYEQAKVEFFRRT